MKIIGCQAAATVRVSRPEMVEQVTPDGGIGLESGSAKPLESLRDYGGSLNFGSQGAVVTTSHRGGAWRLRRPLARARFGDHPGHHRNHSLTCWQEWSWFQQENVTVIRRGATHYSCTGSRSWVTLGWLASRECIRASLAPWFL
jgi:hypothetical protein